MKIMKSENYKKIESSFEGEVYSPHIEDSFVGNVVDDFRRKKRNDFFPQKIPSSYKARHPGTVLTDREQYRELGNLGKERGYVEDPLNFNDVRKKLTRIQKAIERDVRLDQDRYEYYDELTQKDIERIAEDIEEFERKNLGKRITDDMLVLLLKRKNIYKQEKKRNLLQLNKRVSYIINEEDMPEQVDKNETNLILEFLYYLDSSIDVFAKSKHVDPKILKDFLTGNEKTSSYKNKFLNKISGYEGDINSWNDHLQQLIQLVHEGIDFDVALAKIFQTTQFSLEQKEQLKDYIMGVLS